MKYALKESGYGKYKHIKVIRVSDRKARKLEDDGIDTFSSKEKALTKAKTYK